MRFVRLTLAKFGGFAGKTLEFAPPGSVDFIYGPNEAGKSTSLRAVIALCFGIPAQTKDAYLHALSDLRIGAVLRRGNGELLEVVRRKGKKDTLSDSSGRPIAEAVLAGLIGGTTREVYESTYGLDHERLRSGGQALLDGKGELGEAIFGATLGSVSLHALLRETREASQALFAPTARVLPLNAAIRTYDQARRTASEAGTTFEVYDAQERGILEAKADREQAAQRRAQLASERQRLEQIKNLGPVRNRMATRIRELEEEISALRSTLASQVVDEGLLGMEDALIDLQERVGAHRRAQLELPSLHARLASLGRQIEESGSFVVNVAAGLDTSNVAMTAALSSLEDEGRLLDHDEARLIESRRRVQAASRALSPEPETPLGEGRALRAALSAANEAGDLDAALSEATLRASERERNIRALAQGLGWTEPRDPNELAVPSDEAVIALIAEDKRVSERIDRVRDTLRELADETAVAEQKLAASKREGEPPREDELKEARAARDARWRALKESQGFTTAATSGFELSMRGADVLADRMWREADRAAEQASLVLALRTTAQKRRASEQLLVDLERSDEEARNAASRLGRDLGTTLASVDEVSSWMARFSRYREGWEALSAARRELSTQDDALRRLSGRLQVNLTAPSLGASLSELRALARAELEAVGTAMAAASQRALRDEEVKRLRVETEEEWAAYQSRRETWSQRLAVAAESVSLSRTATLSEVIAVAEARMTLSRARRERAEVAARVAELEQVGEALAALVRELSHRHAVDLLAQDAPSAANALMRRGIVAKETAADRRRTLDALTQREDELGRAALEEREAGETIARAMQGLSETRDDKVDERVAGIEIEMDELERRIESASQRIGGFEAMLPRFRDEALQAAAAGEAEEALARVRSLAEEYAMLRLTEAVLAREIERFRAENQGPMLSRASDLFASLTLGAYDGLREGWGDDDRPQLRAARGGDDVSVEALSDGARDQVYFALRIASWERLARTNEPLPIALDDVLVQFDDDRARAALRAIGELAAHMQIMFFTHHARLVEIAREVLLERAHVIELDAPHVAAIPLWVDAP